jgi:hypothetical protein
MGHNLLFRVERSRQADDDTVASGRRGKMPSLALLDPARTGRTADDLENKLGHLIFGQEEAIHQIVRTYQTHVAGLSSVGRPIGNFLFLDKPTKTIQVVETKGV